MTGSALLSEIITILTSALSSFGTAIGSGVSGMVKSLLFEVSGTGSSATTSLSTFGIVLFVFAGIALTIGLSRWIMNWVRSLGN